MPNLKENQKVKKVKMRTMTGNIVYKESVEL